MAILSNGKFYGFLCSVKETGQKLANGAKEYVEDFVSGFVGHGWKIWEYVKGKWMLEIDAIRVRGQFTVFELLVSKIRAIIGAQAITQGCGKIKTVELSEDGTAYLITLEDKDMSFVEHDFIRCQEFIGDKRKYHVEIESVVDGIIRIPITEFTSETDEDGKTVITNPPLPGDDIVQFGNSSYAAAYVGRHSAIYMHADESGQPAIDVLDGIYSKNWSDCLKVRMGGDIPGTDGLKGFYCVNGIIKGIDNDGSILYQFNPDGSGFIGKGSIRWDAAGFRFGTDVKLAWDNLDDETKENLKGESGRDGAPGRDGINGADGVNGADGISLIYKGEFDSHPTSPQQGWYYRNTTDKKCYVFQDNAWYVMTVDGSDGKNGLDGVNGKDGNDGLDIVWKGDSPTPPTNPQKNWVYRDTDNGRVYIYNGTAWQLMVADGNDGVDGTDGAPGGDGKDGMSVFITYHDGEEEPAIPTGDGTAEGWHTDATTSVVWMSQKVSESADTGSWGSPIKIKGNDGLPGSDADVPDWVKKWESDKVQIGDKYMISPMLFTGKNTGTPTEPILTGITQGNKCIAIDGVERSGIFALVDNKVVFELDPINEKYVFTGKVTIADEKILLNEDGSGHLANKKIAWSKDGVCEFEGILRGVIGTFKRLQGIDNEGKVACEIGFDPELGKMYFEGDMQHQGTYRDAITGEKRSYRFLTSDLWCRGEFGHYCMTTMKFNHNGQADFYAYVRHNPYGKNTEFYKNALPGQQIDCVVLEGSGYSVLRICNAVMYKMVTVANRSDSAKRVVYNNQLGLTVDIPAWCFKTFITSDNDINGVNNLYLS